MYLLLCCGYMVKVITIRDDIYAGLYKLKRKWGTSFSKTIEALLKEREAKSRNIFSFTGKISPVDITKKKKFEDDFYGKDMY